MSRSPGAPFRFLHLWRALWKKKETDRESIRLLISSTDLFSLTSGTSFLQRARKNGGEEEEIEEKTPNPNIFGSSFSSSWARAGNENERRPRKRVPAELILCFHSIEESSAQGKKGLNLMLFPILLAVSRARDREKKGTRRRDLESGAAAGCGRRCLLKERTTCRRE